MKLSGHKSNVHEGYTHHELEALRKQIEKVPSFLKASKLPVPMPERASVRLKIKDL